jgi:integrase
LFRFADRREYLTEDPFAKVVLETPNRPVVSRRQEWEPEDLQKWFSSPIYTERFRPKGGMGEAAYWLPVLGLYHGFRLGEMCQLRRTDLIVKQKIDCLIIRPSDEDDDGPERTVKTAESERIVPLHKDVVKDFLAYAKTLDGEQMFPLIRPDTRGRWSGHWSKWFGRYRRTIGLDSRWIDFHSWRHSFKAAATAAHVPERASDEISGHQAASIGRTYGSVPIPTLKKYIDTISFDVTIPKWKSP